MLKVLSMHHYSLPSCFLIRLGIAGATSLMVTLVPTAYAQQSDSIDAEIIVNGDRRSVAGKTERELQDDEIASYGLNSIGALLAEIARERGQETDEAVLLVDGQRINGLGDIDNYPTEAIERLQVLPRGSGPQFGADANRRVINIILRPQVRTVVVRTALDLATQGDWSSRTIELGLTDITRPRRINLAFKAREDEELRESERGIIQPIDASPDLGRFRTLRPNLGDVELKLSLADQITPTISGSVTSRLTNRESRSGLGLMLSGNPAVQKTRRLSGSIDAQANGEFGGWLVLASGSYRQDRRRTRTDALDGTSAEPARTRTRSTATRGEVSATTPVIQLSAGPVSLTLRAGYDQDAIAADADRFVQRRREMGVGLQVPLVAASQEGPTSVGDLSAAIDIRRSHVTRIGSLTNVTYALNWDPRPWLRLSAALVTGKIPPAVESVAGPLISTPGVRSIDPLNGETIDIVEITGGNPLLKAQRDDSRRLSAIVTPFASGALVLSGDYSEIRNRDLVMALPAGAGLLLEAFPERFVRGPNGQLVAVDVRPLNFTRQSERQLRTGIAVTLPIDAGRERADKARLQFDINHAWLLDSRIKVREGSGGIDLLSRDAFGLGGATRPQHEIDATLGYAQRGFGVRVTAQYRSASFLDLGSGSLSDSLRFSPLATFNIRSFIDAQRIAPSVGWLRGARLSVSLNNFTGASQVVRSSSGETPLRYQPAYLDPIGRTLQLELRKAF